MWSRSGLLLPVVVFLSFCAAASAQYDYAGHAALAEAADVIYANMQPTIYVPPETRMVHLPNTLQTLRNGEYLRVVMLGDSIVYQTFQSSWYGLVERHYPGAFLSMVASVRGSTGCDWYKDENRVQDYVFQYNPDLVMIGGISHHGDVPAILEVIQQIRAGCDAEIMVMTGFAGYDYSPYAYPGHYVTPTMTGTDYGSRLMQMAAANDVEFLDLRNVWGDYILHYNMSSISFMGDSVHANDYGKQIIGRAVADYFCVPEPATVILLGTGLIAICRGRRRRVD